MYPCINIVFLFAYFINYFLLIYNKLLCLAYTSMAATPTCLFALVSQNCFSWRQTYLPTAPETTSLFLLFNFAQAVFPTEGFPAFLLSANCPEVPVQIPSVLTSLCRTRTLSVISSYSKCYLCAIPPTVNRGSFWYYLVTSFGIIISFFVVCTYVLSMWNHHESNNSHLSFSLSPTESIQSLSMFMLINNN